MKYPECIGCRFSLICYFSGVPVVNEYCTRTHRNYLGVYFRGAGGWSTMIMAPEECPENGGGNKFKCHGHIRDCEHCPIASEEGGEDVHDV